jgi:hypothetical protein
MRFKKRPRRYYSRNEEEDGSQGSNGEDNHLVSTTTFTTSSGNSSNNSNSNSNSNRSSHRKGRGRAASSRGRRSIEEEQEVEEIEEKEGEEEVKRGEELEIEDIENKEEEERTEEEEEEQEYYTEEEGMYEGEGHKDRKEDSEEEGEEGVEEEEEEHYIEEEGMYEEEGHKDRKRGSEEEEKEEKEEKREVELVQKEIVEWSEIDRRVRKRARAGEIQKVSSNEELDYVSAVRKCNHPLCKTCSIIKESSLVKSSTTQRYYVIKSRDRRVVTCSTKYIVYVCTCKQCGLQYVGETMKMMKTRMGGHRAGALGDGMTTHRLEQSHRFHEHMRNECGMEHLETAIRSS